MNRFSKYLCPSINVLEMRMVLGLSPSGRILGSALIWRLITDLLPTIKSVKQLDVAHAHSRLQAKMKNSKKRAPAKQQPTKVPRPLFKSMDFKIFKFCA